MKKLGLFFSLALALVLLLAACGPANNANNADLGNTENIPGSNNLGNGTTGDGNVETLPETGGEDDLGVQPTSEVATPMATETVEVATPAVTAEVTVEATEAPTEAVTTPEGGEALPGTGTEMDVRARLSDAIDLPVRNADGEDLGNVDNALIDLSQSRVAYAIVDVGGFLGIGARQIAIPWEALDLQMDMMDENAAGESDAAVTPEVTPAGPAGTGTPAAGEPGQDQAGADTAVVAQNPLEDAYFLLNVDDETLDQAPEIDLENLPDTTTPGWDSEIRGYWEGLGVQFDAGMQDAGESSGTGAESMTGTATPAAGGESAGQSGAAAQGQLQGLVPSSDMLDYNVVDNANPDEELGQVEDVVFNVESGQILYVVISAGDALEDMSGNWFLVPLQALQNRIGEEPGFVLAVDRQIMVDAPSFEADNLPDFNVDTWDDEIESYWETNVEMEGAGASQP